MLTHHQLPSGNTSLNYGQTQPNELRTTNSNSQEIAASRLNSSQTSLPHSSTKLEIPIDVSTRSATILIVDDTPNNLQVLFSYLETAGFKVLLAEDSQSAIQIARSQHPDLILLDVLMPNVDGFATCSQLKSQASTKDIPVIFLTALSDTINKVQDSSWVELTILPNQSNRKKF